MNRSTELILIPNAPELADAIRPYIVDSRLDRAFSKMPLTTEDPEDKMTKLARLAVNAGTDSGYRVWLKHYQSIRATTTTMKLASIGRNDDLSVSIRSRRALVEDDHGRLVKGSDGMWISKEIDYLFEPDRLAWKRFGGATLNLVARGTYFRTIYEPSLAKVDARELSPELALSQLFDVAAVLSQID